MADVASYLEVDNPIDLLEKRNRVKAGLKDETFWETWLRPALSRGQENAYAKLAVLIDNDIMKVRQITRRDILHEMTDDFRVDVYFVLDRGNYLNLRLLPPTHPLPDSEASRNELERLILGIQF